MLVTIAGYYYWFLLLVAIADYYIKSWKNKLSMQLQLHLLFLCIPCVLISARPLPRVPDALDINNWRPNRDPEKFSGGSQVGLIYYRVMGQVTSSPYVSILKHLLKMHGASVSRGDLEACIEVIKEYNPWFPDEGTLDLENWVRIRENVEKAFRQGERIPVRFWSIWSLIYSVFKAMQEERLITHLENEASPSIKEFDLDDATKVKIKEDQNELFGGGRSEA